MSLPSNTVIKKRILGALLRNLRLKRELTMTKAAEMAGMSPTTVSSVERGKYMRSPLLETALRLAYVYGITGGILLTWYEKGARVVDARWFSLSSGDRQFDDEYQDAIFSGVASMLTDQHVN